MSFSTYLSRPQGNGLAPNPKTPARKMLDMMESIPELRDKMAPVEMLGEFVSTPRGEIQKLSESDWDEGVRRMSRFFQSCNPSDQFIELCTGRPARQRPKTNKVAAAGKALDPMIDAIKRIDERFPDCPKPRKP